MPKGPNTPSVHEYIRDCLKQRGEATVSEVAKDVREWCRENDWQQTNRSTVYTYMKIYQAINLVEQCGTRSTGNTGFGSDANVYRIKNDVTAKWQNPRHYYRQRA